MSHYKPSSKLSKQQVDWNDPHLQSLLQKTEHWRLDNRGSFSAEEVRIFVGMGDESGHTAYLVWEGDQVAVLETLFSIRNGEHVRMDRPSSAGMRTTWGVIVEGREGHREEDRQHGVHVHWLHMC
jgi:hypothetical protein